MLRYMFFNGEMEKSIPQLSPNTPPQQFLREYFIYILSPSINLF